jgi:hypothetical protein
MRHACLAFVFALSLTPFIGCDARHPVPAPGDLRGERIRPVFRDVAAEAGLTFRWGYGGKSPLNIVETAAGGAGFIDYDRDGLLDVVLVGRSIALYHNDGEGRFREVSAGSGLDVFGALMGCAVGDYDNDGWPDLFVTGHGTARLYRNRNGNGAFQDVTTAAGVAPRSRRGATIPWSTSAGFADLDADGFLDLVVGHYLEFTPRSRQLCDYPAAIGGGPVFAACPPLYYESQRLVVYRNRGDGTFEEVSDRFPGAHGNNLALGFADYDDDGRLDLYVANDALPADLFRNRGDWSFENMGTASATAFNQDGGEQAGMGVDWGDYDGDGRLDLIVTTFQNEPRSLYRNEGNGLFYYASYAALLGEATKSRLAFGGGFLDYDNDGALDLLFANGHVQDTIGKIRPPATYAQTMQLFRNRGDGIFAEVSAADGAAFGKPIVGRAVAFGDYDNDGRMDALVADLDGAPLLLHNESAEGANADWLGVRLLSRHGGRDAIGARVTLELAAGGKRIAEAQTCRSYLSAGDARVHFGLGGRGSGENRVVPRLIVRWPGGATSTLENVRTGRYLTIDEASTP